MMNFYCVKCGVNYPPGERCLCKPEASPTPKPSCEMQLLASIDPKPEGADELVRVTELHCKQCAYHGHVVKHSALTVMEQERNEWRHEAQVRSDEYAKKCAEVTACEAKLAEMVATARQAQDLCFKQHAELMAERDAYAGMKLAWEQERERADAAEQTARAQAVLTRPALSTGDMLLKDRDAARAEVQKLQEKIAKLSGGAE